ncbi:hypothetical protein STEG23_001843, partial [Scotinomys teguina]
MSYSQIMAYSYDKTPLSSQKKININILDNTYGFLKHRKKLSKKNGSYQKVSKLREGSLTSTETIRSILHLTTLYSVDSNI